VWCGVNVSIRPHEKKRQSGRDVWGKGQKESGVRGLLKGAGEMEKREEKFGMEEEKKRGRVRKKGTKKNLVV
jgi:hypothetical protein